LTSGICDRVTALLTLDVAEVDPALPVELQTIITKALQKKRSDRYQTVNELLADLRTLKQERVFRERLKSSS
jgi:hypothetical protein